MYIIYSDIPRIRILTDIEFKLEEYIKTLKL